MKKDVLNKNSALKLPALPASVGRHPMSTVSDLSITLEDSENVQLSTITVPVFQNIKFIITSEHPMFSTSKPHQNHHKNHHQSREILCFPSPKSPKSRCFTVPRGVAVASVAAMAYFPGSLVTISGLPDKAQPVASAQREGVQALELNGDRAQLLHFDKATKSGEKWRKVIGRSLGYIYTSIGYRMGYRMVEDFGGKIFWWEDL